MQRSRFGVIVGFAIRTVPNVSTSPLARLIKVAKQRCRFGWCKFDAETNEVSFPSQAGQQVYDAMEILSFDMKPDVEGYGRKVSFIHAIASRSSLPMTQR